MLKTCVGIRKTLGDQLLVQHAIALSMVDVGQQPAVLASRLGRRQDNADPLTLDTDLRKCAGLRAIVHRAARVLGSLRRIDAPQSDPCRALRTVRGIDIESITVNDANTGKELVMVTIVVGPSRRQNSFEHRYTHWSQDASDQKDGNH